MVAMLKVCGVGAAAVVAFDPSFAAVGVDFFFPDREAMFDVVDNVAAGQKSIASMVSGHADTDCDVADGECADSMDYGGFLNAKFRFGFVENRLGNAGRELGVAAVMERGHGFAFVMIAHPPLVAAIRAGTDREQLLAQFSWGDGVACELESHFGRSDTLVAFVVFENEIRPCLLKMVRRKITGV